MKCVMNRGIYLRADGRLPCYCGAGETVTLGVLPRNRPFNFISDYYHNPAFARIRTMMAEELTPWPGICDQCTYLEVEAEDDAGLIETEVEWFHWEPSYLCMLDCEWCRGQRNGGESSKDRLLPWPMFKEVIDSLAEAGLTLKMGNVCGVGEPTTNTELWDQIKTVRDRLGGDILVSTNGNGPYSEKIVPSGLTKIKIAVDAVSQAAYQRYRKNGSLRRAMEFTRKVAEDKVRFGSEHPIIIWQYILFNYNDSDEDLIYWQNLALDHGVDRLRFVFTRCNKYSLRTPDQIP
ncbi:MAG: radical SAM protein, partial [Pseudomonadota bacterium]